MLVYRIARSPVVVMALFSWVLKPVTMATRTTKTAAVIIASRQPVAMV
jgi:hypothetical protein